MLSSAVLKDPVAHQHLLVVPLGFFCRYSFICLFIDGFRQVGTAVEKFVCVSLVRGIGGVAILHSRAMNEQTHLTLHRVLHFVKPGRILFEINGVDPELAKKALRLGAAKLPIKTRMVSREGE